MTLLMFTLGLGCLSLVFHGLIDGVVDGARGASFAFAAKPVKFLLIELFWLGLGLVLLLGAWRGVSRQEVDVDDEHDEHDEDDEAMPSSTVARTPTSDRKQPVLPVPVPVAKVGNLNANSAGAVSKAATPKALELYTSRFYAVLVIIVFTLFVIVSAYTAVALTTIFGKVLVMVFMLPTALVYVLTMVQCMRNFFWVGPVLVLQEFGITNYRKDGHMIPWTEVEAVRLDARGTSTYLVLRFRRASDVNSHFGKTRWLQSITGRLFYKGFEGRVKLTSLGFKRSVVLQTAQAFLRYSRR